MEMGKYLTHLQQTCKSTGGTAFSRNWAVTLCHAIFLAVIGKETGKISAVQVPKNWQSAKYGGEQFDGTEWREAISTVFN